MSSHFQLCILRLSAIGDVCHAVAMVTRLRKFIPDIKITWIIGKIEYQLLQGMSNVEFIVYDKKGGKEAKQQVIEKLAGREFDAMFIMQVALRANMLSSVVKAKRKIGFDWGRSKEGHWLFANERIDAKKHAHVLDGFMGFADRLLSDNSISKALSKSLQNAEQDNKREAQQETAQPLVLEWDIPIPTQDRDWAKQQTQTLGKYVVISPAASKAERNWSPAGYAAAAERCTELGYSVVLSGGPSELDKGLAENIQNITNKVTLDLVAKTSLKQMLAVLKGASLVIAPDTGPAHMATTVGTPVLGLYAHSNPLRTGPYSSLDAVVSVYDQCIEAQKGKSWQSLPWGVRAKGKDLMQNITIPMMLAQLDKCLDAAD